MKLRVVTPARVVVDADVTELTAPGMEGEFGVLPNHVKFLGSLDSGILTYVAGGSKRRIVVHGGYAEVKENVVTVLANEADVAEEIDTETARAELREAEEALSRERDNPDEIERLNAVRRLAQYQVEAAASRRG
jgi:F-type H+-transporting ATPase subunit epsilon